jgi:hypothetical protein
MAAQPTIPMEPARQAQVLHFDRDEHRYWLEPSGEPLPSVTQVLKESGLIDYSMIPQDVLNHAARRGTAVHRTLELLDVEMLERSHVDPEIEPYVAAYEAFVRDTGFTPARIECRMWHPVYRYAGTFDRDGVFGDGSLTILDFKSGLVMEAHALQLAAYAAFLPEPRKYRRIALGLGADGKYRVHEYPAKEFQSDLGVFLAALACAKWARKERTR